MRKSLLCAIPLIASLFVPVAAQSEAEEMHGPPKVLLIVKEDIKPGMMNSHNRHSSNYVSVFSKLQTPNHRIAMTPVAGSENEVVYLTGCESFAELERILNETNKKMGGVNASMQTELDKLDKEAGHLHSGMRDVWALLRPDLGFNSAAPIPQMRYFAVTTVRLRPGRDAQYANYVSKILALAKEKAKPPENFHIAVYQVVSGAPGGTYLVFRPMKSLAEMDMPIGRKLREAMSDEMKKESDKEYSEMVMSTETSVYAFAPKLSFLPKEFTSLDPDFWTPQSQVATSPKPRKRTAVAAKP